MAGGHRRALPGGSGRFFSPAHFSEGNQLVLTGTVSGCPRGDWLFLTVTVQQGKHGGTGAWPHLDCSGHRQHWSMTVVNKSAKWRSGKAKASAVGKVFKCFKLCPPKPPCVKDAKIVQIKRWHGTIALKPVVPAR